MTDEQKELLLEAKFLTFAAVKVLGKLARTSLSPQGVRWDDMTNRAAKIVAELQEDLG